MSQLSLLHVSLCSCDDELSCISEKLSSLSKIGKEDTADGNPATACSPAIAPEITVSATSPRGDEGPDDGVFVRHFGDVDVCEFVGGETVIGT